MTVPGLQRQNQDSLTHRNLETISIIEILTGFMTRPSLTTFLGIGELVSFCLFLGYFIAKVKNPNIQKVFLIFLPPSFFLFLQSQFLLILAIVEIQKI